ncbi:pilus assembly protein CpaC [Bisgaardia hudsonensis]|uniref:Pilus assembly protein CpaC n=1 Tax=Bisgaardia hudsonensis TaxID=109472 RepID=A0A4R2N009_9PAST|nr:type II and III secretion system protein family protein [Bisgaardia hudsonensis]QLB12354.1 secretin [Bisgaardia hudsonensis]TCP12403.1 pilus assembly protein CpaC [Bisgaardia hudsonensis]
MFIRRTIASSLLILSSFLPLQLLAKSFYLEEGQSHLVELNEKIDTIFVATPDIADYEIIDDNRFMVYAKKEGRTTINVFDEEGKTLTSDTIYVNAAINNISHEEQQIQTRIPDSELRVKKVGKAYIIEGKAKNEREIEQAERIMGAALGESPTVTEATLKSGSGSEKVDFLSKYEYNNVINNSVLESATQINVKLSVVEVNKTFTEQLGVDWSTLSGSLVNNSPGATKGFTKAQGIISIDASKLSLFINAVNNQDNGKILAEPNISMLSGETADILVGGEIPFVQRDEKGNPTIIYKDFGIKLAVGAKVQKNDRIRLVLAQEVSTIAGHQKINDSDLPYFNTRRSKSTFEIANGESFIIGGLYSSDDLEGLAKVPLLGDIPIFGSLFRNIKTSRTNKELVIVATVNLVKAVNGDDITYPTFESTGTMERFFNLTPMKNVYYKTLTTNFLRRGGFIQ